MCLLGFCGFFAQFRENFFNNPRVLRSHDIYNHAYILYSSEIYIAPERRELAAPGHSSGTHREHS